MSVYISASRLYAENNINLDYRIACRVLLFTRWHIQEFSMEEYFILQLYQSSIQVLGVNQKVLAALYDFEFILRISL